MGIQTVNSHEGGDGQLPHVQQKPMQCSLFSLTLNELENHVSDLGKPLGNMDLDELLKKVTSADQAANYASSAHHEACLSLALAFSGKTLNEIWMDIGQGCKARDLEEISSQEREMNTLGETTLEDFLLRVGIYVADASLGPVMGLGNAPIEGFTQEMGLSDVSTPESFTPQNQMGLTQSPSVDVISDSPRIGRKRDNGSLDKILERRLRRKIKNRESAARSRARKQAYHDELVNKVSRLEEDIKRLIKAKEFDKMVCSNFSKPRCQLRRTSSL